MRQELPRVGGCETRVTWVGEGVRQELPGWERGCETRVTWVGERVRQELPGWERG